MLHSFPSSHGPDVFLASVDHDWMWTPSQALPCTTVLDVEPPCTTVLDVEPPSPLYWTWSPPPSPSLSPVPRVHPFPISLSPGHFPVSCSSSPVLSPLPSQAPCPAPLPHPIPIPRPPPRFPVPIPGPCPPHNLTLLLTT